MPKIAGGNHLDAVRALEKIGFQIRRQGKHIIMSDGTRIVTVPRHNPVHAITMGTIARGADLTIAGFRQLLKFRGLASPHEAADPAHLGTLRGALGRCGPAEFV